MRKRIIFPLFFVFIACFLVIKNRNQFNVQEQHASLVEQHNLQKTLKLQKKQRLEAGLPPNKYLEQKYLLEIDPRTGITHPENIYKVQQELKEKQQILRRTPGDAIDNEWVERGPDNVGGRTRVVLFDPNDTTHKRVFAGGVSGGLWVNDDITDANSSWSQVGIADNLSVTCMAVDPNNSQIMYLGTGELYAPQQALGNGIWKSTDGGATWSNVYQITGTTTNTSLISVPGTYFMTDIVVRDKDGDPLTTNDSEVFASIGSSFYSSNPKNTFIGISGYGIFKSTDEGVNWNIVTLEVNGNPVAANDFEIGADNTLWMSTTRNIFGDGGGSIYSSSDGTNFVLKHTITDGRRTEIAVSKTNANTVYVLGRVFTQDESNNLIAPFVSLLKTTDAFATAPTTLSLPNDADNGIPADDFTRSQAFYNLVIEVDPNDDTIAYAGGIDLFRTTDSGTNWTQISKWSNNNNLAALSVPLVHADQHSWMFHPTDSDKAIIGNDGGVYYATSLSTASTTTTAIASRNKNYNTVQFYNGAISQTISPEYILGGTQDNGTQFFNDASSGINSTTQVFSGDGTHCFIDKDGAYMIVSYLYNRILRFNLPYTGVFQSIENDSDSGDFVNAMALDDNLDIVYANGSDHLARYTDITTNAPERTNIADALLTNITAIRVSPFTTTSSKVFAGTRAGNLVKIDNAETATPTVTDISSDDFLGSISSVEFGANEDEIMVTFYNFGVESIWFTVDGGTTWQNKEGDFPDINVRCILMNPLNTDEVIIGTELGVWNTSNFRDSSPNWNHSYNGMSNVAVTSLNLRTADHTVLASSYGRGMYTGTFKANNLTTWIGAIDSDWTNAGNWSNGIPATNIDVKILEANNQPEITTTVTLANLSIENNASLLIESSGALTIEEDLTNQGTFTINSSLSNSGSLIVEGNATENITYNRAVSNNWHLVGPPVSGQIYNDDWVVSNAIASGTVNPNLRGIATYDNSLAWQYMMTGQSDTFMKGTGYSILRTASGNLSFTGTLLTTDTTKDITNGTNNAFNLIGNVYTSYIPINNGADAVNDFLDHNVNALSELTVWLWNGTSYTPVNHVTADQFIAPGQGFFVRSKSDGGTVSFSTAMQNHQNATFFKNQQSRPEIRVVLSKGKLKKHTDIFYIDHTTAGFDNGYDSSLYTGSSSSLEIYTKLVNQEKDMNLAIQSIPKDYSVVIPIGIIAQANDEVKISIEAKNIDEENNIYLEDKETGVFTLLNTDKASYSFTTNAAINGYGRFFLHTLSEVLQTNENEVLSKVNIFSKNDKLIFTNLPVGKKSVEVYSVSGKLIVKKQIEISNFISTKNIARAPYIIRINTAKGSINRKILIN